MPRRMITPGIERTGEAEVERPWQQEDAAIDGVQDIIGNLLADTGQLADHYTHVQLHVCSDGG